MSRENHRQLNEIYRPMNEELFNNLDKQYKELAKVKTKSEQIEQIEEMARTFCGGCDRCLHGNCRDWYNAEAIYNADYRKITTTDWLTKGVSQEQIEKEKQEAFEEIAEQLGYRKQEWINVEERLPDKEGKFLVYRTGFINHITDILYYTPCYSGHNEGMKNRAVWFENDSDWGEYEIYGVTHWMPLPEAPKMKGGE